MTVAVQEETRTKVRGARRWVLPAGLVVAGLVCVGAIILALNWPFSSKEVLQSIQEDWPGKITVQHFRRTYFSHPGCVMENVTLTRGPETSGPALVTIQKLTIAANYHDLFLRPGYISRILLEGLHVSVPAENPGGESASQTSNSANSANSKVRLGEVFTRDAILEIATKGDGPLKFEIHRLSLRSVSEKTPWSYELAMRNAQPPGEIVARGKLGPWKPQDLKNMPVSGKYTFDQADLSVFHGISGTLASKGEFHGVLGQIETHGTVDIPDFEVTHSKHSVELKTKFDALVDGTTGDTALRTVDATFLRTAVHAEGTVEATAGKPGKTTSLNLTVRQGHIDDVLRLFVKEEKPPMSGMTNFRAHVVWPSDRQPFVKGVVLQGEFAIENAQWENRDQQTNLNTLSKRASGEKKDAPTPEVTAEMQGSVSLSGGVAKFHDSTFTVPGAVAKMNGTYNLENTKIDFHGTLKTEASISEDTTGVKSVLLKPVDPLFKRKHAGADVPVEMTGTYADAHVGVSVVPKK